MSRTWTSWDNVEYELVFSDEFNQEGRTFYPGDDPYWEAMDLWYGATQDMEWYSPGASNLLVKNCFDIDAPFRTSNDSWRLPPATPRRG